ncbi:hypothetical protein EJF16_10696 [Clavispora lusitaniae]|nr:hypothetical protein EJF16_10696 [Clavispora lusitaniae]
MNGGPREKPLINTIFIFESSSRRLQWKRILSFKLGWTQRSQIWSLPWSSVHARLIYIDASTMQDIQYPDSMSKVPAWKRLGLQVKDEVSEDPLATTTHLEHDNVTNKIAKSLNRKRRLEEQKDGAKKPPKRVKVPKSERKPPPEKDQLAYLRQYAEDKDNWKFSKQKQNWLLKNIESIPQNYEASLILYVEGIQGGARTRLVEQLKQVVEKWNAVAQAVEDRVNAQLYGTGEEKKDENETKEEKEETKEESGPSKEYAIRCNKLLAAISEEEIVLKGVEEQEKEEDKQEEKEEDRQKRRKKTNKKKRKRIKKKRRKRKRIKKKRRKRRTKKKQWSKKIRSILLKKR